MDDIDALQANADVEKFWTLIRRYRANRPEDRYDPIMASAAGVLRGVGVLPQIRLTDILLAMVDAYASERQEREKLLAQVYGLRPLDPVMLCSDCPNKKFVVRVTKEEGS